MSTYAARTKVPVARTVAEIERTLARYGGTGFEYYSEEQLVVVLFNAFDRHLRFDLPLFSRAVFDGDELEWKQHRRQAWRALLLSIKAKLEVVESGIETFECAFMANIVMPDGRTFGDIVGPTIAEAYKTGKTPVIHLPPPAEDCPTEQPRDLSDNEFIAASDRARPVNQET